MDIFNKEETPQVLKNKLKYLQVICNDLQIKNSELHLENLKLRQQGTSKEVRIKELLYESSEKSDLLHKLSRKHTQSMRHLVEQFQNLQEKYNTLDDKSRHPKDNIQDNMEYRTLGQSLIQSNISKQVEKLKELLDNEKKARIQQMISHSDEVELMKGELSKLNKKLKEHSQESNGSQTIPPEKDTVASLLQKVKEQENIITILKEELIQKKKASKSEDENDYTIDDLENLMDMEANDEKPEEKPKYNTLNRSSEESNQQQASVFSYLQNKIQFLQSNYIQLDEKTKNILKSNKDTVKNQNKKSHPFSTDNELGNQIRLNQKIISVPPKVTFDYVDSGRLEVANKIVTSEEEYLSNLRMFDSMIQPIKANIVKKLDIVSLFYSIYHYHRNFYQELKLRVSSMNDGSSSISDLFLKTAGFLKIYKSYAKKFVGTLYLLNQKKFWRELWDDLEHEENVDNTETNADSIIPGRTTNRKNHFCLLLTKPMQRITEYYDLLLKFKKNTPREHPDINVLPIVLSRMKETANVFREILQSLQNINMVIDIFTNIVDTNIIQFSHTRRLVMEGTALLVSDQVKQWKKPCYLFLFNDLVLITKPKNSTITGLTGHKKLFKYISHLILTPKINTTTIATDQSMLVINIEKETLTIKFPSGEDKIKWEKSINRIISNMAEGSVYGPLTNSINNSNPAKRGRSISSGSKNNKIIPPPLHVRTRTKSLSQIKTTEPNKPTT